MFLKIYYKEKFRVLKNTNNINLIHSSIFSECFGSYGVNCQYICDVYCINQTCDRINGSCLFGCEEDEICGQDISY